MKIKKIIALFSVMLLMAVTLTGCFSGPEPASTEPAQGDAGAQGKILKVNNSSEPGALHPGKAQGTHDSWVLEHVFEGLTKKSPEGIIKPGMAETWDVSEDGLVWTFHLRDGVVWSNEDPVTAEDFEYAWKYVLNPKTASEYAYQLYYLANGQEFNSASIDLSNEELKALEDKVGVKALDEKTLEVTLAQPTPYFLDLTSFYTLYPINKKVQEENPEWSTEAASYVSNGPFKLVEWKHKENLLIKKNDNYYDKDSIKLDGINFTMIEDENTAWQMYRTGDLDLAYPLPQDVVAQLNETNDPEFVVGNELATYFYRFNTTKKPFNNVKVRKALSMAIDRETITEHVAQGGQRPAYGLTPPGIPDVSGDYQENTGNLFEKNFDQAKLLLTEGLADEGLDSMPPFVILYNTQEGHKKIAEAVQEMWRKNLGLDVTLENVEFQVKIDRESALEYDVSRAGWIGDYVDPMTFVDMFVTDGGQNDTGWGNKEYDRLISVAKSTMDQEVRMKAMRDAETILMDEMPIIPIYFYTKPFTQKPYLTGVYTPINRYPQFQYADLKK